MVSPGGHTIKPVPGKSWFFPPAAQLRLILGWILRLKQLFLKEKLFYLLRITLPSLFTEKEGKKEGREGGTEWKKGEKEEENVCYCLLSFLIIFFTWLIDQKILQWKK